MLSQQAAPSSSPLGRISMGQACSDTCGGERGDAEAFRGLDAPQRALCLKLSEDCGQAHLFAGWRGKPLDERKRLAAALVALDTSVDIGAYVARARTLLADAAASKNALEGSAASVPTDGEFLAVGSARAAAMEALGLEKLRSGKVGFVLVAGGLGERLGYGGVKLALPVETTTNRCYLAHYAAFLDAWGGAELAIMTSDDTHARTAKLVAKHGLRRVALLKQAKVPALADASAKIAVGDDLLPLTKPHGHGDVHGLMHASGTARRWADSGVEQILFFQDTNALALYACAGCVGVSCDRRLEMNTMSIPRRAKQEMGAIAALDKGGTRVVCNVEYNQLAPLLVAQGGAGDEPDPATGLSPFPGNTNCFVLDAKKYADKLAATGGVVPEFVNPKFADESRTAFAKPARLESMMQDYPKLCDGAVGFTSITPWYCYSPVKNAAATAKKNADKGVPPACAASGEADFYRCGAELLKALGCAVDLKAKPTATAAGVPVSLGPRVILDPSFATCYADLAAKLPHPSKIRISARSTLLLSGAGLVVEHLVLDGALQLKAVDDGELVVKRLRVKNKGYELAPLGGDAPEELRIRGFAWAKREQRNITAHAGDKLVVEESRLKAVAAAVMLTP